MRQGRFYYILNILTFKLCNFNVIFRIVGSSIENSACKIAWLSVENNYCLINRLMSIRRPIVCSSSGLTTWALNVDYSSHTVLLKVKCVLSLYSLGLAWISQTHVIFTHLKLWIAIHNFNCQWLKIQMPQLRALGVKKMKIIRTNQSFNTSYSRSYFLQNLAVFQADPDCSRRVPCGVLSFSYCM